MIVLERLECFKFLFEIKYKKNLENVFYLTKERDAILVLYLLCKSYEEKHWISFGFYRMVEETRYKLLKEMGEESRVGETTWATNLKIKKEICKSKD